MFVHVYQHPLPLPLSVAKIFSKMSAKGPPSGSKPVKSILKSKSTKRAKIAVPVTPKATAADPKPSAKSKGKQREKNPVAAQETKNKTAPEPTSRLSSTFNVVTGSYEKLLYGLEGTISSTSSSEALSVELTPTFIFPAHVSCIKAVAASPNGGKWLATGSSDEIVKVWDLKRKKEIGGLMHHEGELNVVLLMFNFE